MVIIGSGHNGLVAAAYLARAGLSVEVLERNPTAGGAVTSEELTDPGYVHDTFSSWHPLFKLSAAFAELGEELAIPYCETPAATTANVRADGARRRSPTATPSRPSNRSIRATGPPTSAEMQSFGETIPTVGQLFGVELFSGGAPKLGVQLARQLGVKRGLRFASDLVSSARGWFETRFEGREVADLYSPWALHTGLAPDAAGSGFQALAIAGSLHAVGLPVVEGGASNFVARVRTAHRAARRRASPPASRSSGSSPAAAAPSAWSPAAARSQATRGVVANTTPTQLYGRLLARRGAARRRRSSRRAASATARAPACRSTSRSPSHCGGGTRA